MNPLELDPLAWLGAGYALAANIAAFLAGVGIIVLAAFLMFAGLSGFTDALRRRRTSRRAWRQQG